MSQSITWMVGSTPPFMNPSSLRRIKYPKSPSDLTPVTCDFRGALAALDNDTLLPNSVPGTHILRNDGQAADLYVVGPPVMNPDNTRVTVWLAGGSYGYEYLVSVTVMSLDGQEFTRSFVMPVGLR